MIEIMIEIMIDSMIQVYNYSRFINGTFIS